jgi:hypothetical protein
LRKLIRIAVSHIKNRAHSDPVGPRFTARLLPRVAQGRAGPPGRPHLPLDTRRLAGGTPPHPVASGGAEPVAAGGAQLRARRRERASKVLHTGTWWPSDRPENPVAGSLVRDGRQYTVLRTVGELVPLAVRDERDHTIVGRSVHGILITLYQAVRVSSRWHGGTESRRRHRSSCQKL